MNAVRSTLVALSALAMTASLVGCDADPYCFNCALDATLRPDAIEVGQVDAVTVDAIVRDRPQTDVAMDIADSADACAGRDFSSDPLNCGSCGNVCMLRNAFPACRMGRCAIASCDTNYYDFNNDPSDGCETQCTFRPGVTNDRVCDGLDDNCNGRIDEDVDFCGSADNCGSCARQCRFLHAAATCARTDGMTTGACSMANTRCQMGACEANYFDRNGDPSDGCETMCVATGPETCNGLDDDCDGVVDNGNPGGGVPCGSTRGVCRQGTTACTMGAIQCMGSIEPTPERCNNLDDDCNGMVDDGDLLADERVRMRCGSGVGDCVQGVNQCMGGAIVCVGASVPGSEVCDGRDNDCNGRVDDGIASPGPCGRSVGTCRAGTLQCAGGAIVCQGAVAATTEVCNGMDDDCDGTVDNGFDTLRDPLNCGGCGITCTGRFPHAVASCQTGSCRILACQMGYFDDTTSPGADCNYACDFQSATEICNGRDDNCNGQIDEGVTAPSGFCRTAGPCTGATARCTGRGGFVCTYPSGVELDPATGQPPAVETRCDGVDNNCNGAIDESFTTLGQACGSGVGACASVGRVVCNTAGTGTTCNAGAVGTPTAELCDGIDNDCDGAIDENGSAPGTNASYVRNAWVSVSGTGASTLWMMQYEASRPGASATSVGTGSARACSSANVLPWTNLTVIQASDACTAAGARLCTETEWTSACRSSTGTCTWSYGAVCSTYSSTTCNGYDFTPAGGVQGVIPTGTMAACFGDLRTTRPTPNQVFDLSGNVKEFTAPRSPGVNPLRGGSYNNIAGGTACTFDWTVVDDDFAFSNTGFRCCYTGATPP